MSKVILAYMKYADKSRFSIMAASIRDNSTESALRQIKDLGIQHFCVGSKVTGDFTVISKLVKLFRELNVDIVNTNNADACWYGHIAAKIARVPVVVFTLHGIQSKYYNLHFAKGIGLIFSTIDRLTMVLADKIVAVSEYARKYYMQKQGIPHHKIVTILNGVDLAPLHNLNFNRQTLCSKLGIAEEEMVVGIVAALKNMKGHSYLISAAPDILSNCPATRFLVVGDGPHRKIFEKQVEALGLNKKFIFTGHQSNIPELLSIMDVFTLPSLTEGLPIALMEAMAAELPCVVTDIPGCREVVISGKTGYFVPVEDPKALANAIVRLLLNVKLRKEFGKAGRQRVETVFDARVMAQRYEKLYLNLLNVWCEL